MTNAFYYILIGIAYRIMFGLTGYLMNIISQWLACLFDMNHCDGFGKSVKVMASKQINKDNLLFLMIDKNK